MDNPSRNVVKIKLRDILILGFAFLQRISVREILFSRRSSDWSAARRTDRL